MASPISDPRCVSAAGEGEITLGPAEFQRIAKILRADAGISLKATKTPLVYSRLVKRLRALGLSNFIDYCALVDAPDGREERQRLVAALTTNVTRFFREPHHFMHLKRTVLPDLVARARRGASVRLWSAGCSSGEEPYSLALTILSLFADAPRFDVKILASDIDRDSLARAERGIYPERALSQIEPDLRERWFRRVESHPEERCWRIGDEARALVAFRSLNLMGDWPMKRTFDVILCRNVVIYFEEPDRERLWRRMAVSLAPESYLYVGHAERVSAARDVFDLVGITTYRRKPEEKS